MKTEDARLLRPWIIVVPSRDIVIVATGNAISVEKHATALQLLYDVILPAAH